MKGAECLSVTKVIISATVRFIYNLSAKLAPLSVAFLSWLVREHWQQFIRNLDKIAASNENRKK